MSTWETSASEYGSYLSNNGETELLRLNMQKPRPQDKSDAGGVQRPEIVPAQLYDNKTAKSFKRHQETRVRLDNNDSTAQTLNSTFSADETMKQYKDNRFQLPPEGKFDLRALGAMEGRNNIVLGRTAAAENDLQAKNAEKWKGGLRS